MNLVDISFSNLIEENLQKYETLMQEKIKVLEKVIKSQPEEIYIYNPKKPNLNWYVYYLIPPLQKVIRNTSIKIFHKIEFLQKIKENSIIIDSSPVFKNTKKIKKLDKIYKKSFTIIDLYTVNRYFNIFNYDQFKGDYFRNKEKYDFVYSLLKDNKSKKQFLQVILFRLTFNMESLGEFSHHPETQYFEDFLELKEEYFVDGGAFDGETSLLFANNYPDYKKIYLFEPIPEFFSLCEGKLKDIRDINFYNIALYNKKENLNFLLSGAGSRENSEGSIVVQADSLDNLIKDKVTFIKLDIEGAEPKAIEGMKNIILKYHPKLALCVYHKKEHIYSIVEDIFRIRNDYDLYFRHYSNDAGESVMFFLPKD